MTTAVFSEYLETYQGRDKCLRLLSYVAKLGTLVAKTKDGEQKFKIFSSKISGSRVILRLLDDIPMIHYAITYGWGEQEPDWLIRYAELIQITVDTIFYPVEHISWAGENRLISINVDKWDLASTWFWIVSLNLSLLKSSRKLIQLRQALKSNNDKNLTVRERQKLLHTQQNNELMTCLRLLLDISYAVSYLPQGTLWGGRFKPWHVGALGTISSLIGLYQSLSKFVMKKRVLS